jgi:predicted MFS family arabinose efflux permease
MAIPLGSALGYAWGELFAKYMGWRWAFYAVVPPGLVLGAMALMRKDVRPQKAAGQHTAKFADYLQLLRNRSYIFDCAGMCAMTFAIGGIAFWMPHYLTEIRHAGEHASTIFGLISAVGGIVATLAGGRAGDWLRKRTSGAYFIVSGFGILLGCPFVLLMLVLPFPYAWGALFMAVFFLFFNTGPSNAILANVTQPRVRATAFALNIFLIHILGDAVSPPMLGKIAANDTRWNRTFFVVAIMMALAGALWLWGARYLADDTERAEQMEEPVHV